MASRAFARASAKLSPSVKHPGSSGISTEYPPSGSSIKSTLNFRLDLDGVLSSLAIFDPPFRRMGIGLRLNTMLRTIRSLHSLFRALRL